MFKYWLLRFKLWLLDRERVKTKMSMRLYVFRLATLLEPKQLIQRKTSDFFGYYIESDVPSVDALVAKFQQINSAIRGVGFVRVSIIDLETNSVPLEYFLSVTQTGYYADIVSMVDRLKSVVLDYTKLMENTDEAEFGDEEHNRRVTARLLYQTSKLLRLLLEIKPQ